MRRVRAPAGMDWRFIADEGGLAGELIGIGVTFERPITSSQML